MKAMVTHHIALCMSDKLLLESQLLQKHHVSCHSIVWTGHKKQSVTSADSCEIDSENIEVRLCHCLFSQHRVKQ